MLDHDELRRWRAEALGALDAARLAQGGGRHNWACFLAEQSAQLAIKGLLHGVGAAPWGHDLVDLGRKLAPAVETPLADDLAAALRGLSRHYIPARNPDALPGGSPGERYFSCRRGRGDRPGRAGRRGGRWAVGPARDSGQRRRRDRGGR